ncbi:hypothetical protein Tco_0132791 [Tanacetum coccineum]
MRLAVSASIKTNSLKMFDEYEKKSPQMVQHRRETMRWHLSLRYVMAIEDSPMLAWELYLVRLEDGICGDSVQQECYRPFDMTASMDTHADVTEGDASSLLVTSSSNVIVASDDGISQEDPTHYANAGTTYVHATTTSAPAMVLDDSCVVKRDLQNYVMGEVKQFSSISNLRTLLLAEGFHNVKLAYIGGLWVMVELESSKVKTKFMKHVGVGSWL